MAKARKCKHCGTKKPVDDGVLTPIYFFCSTSCAYQYTNAQREKQQARQKQKAIQSHKEAEKADRKRLRERKEKLRPVKFYLDKAQAMFNRYIRLRDKGKPCVSCGKPDDGTHQIHASHFRSRGACSSLRFDESNVHASCSKCNNWLSGNIAGYSEEIVNRIGEAELERIKSAPKDKKWTKEEAIDVYKKYKEKINHM